MSDNILVTTIVARVILGDVSHMFIRRWMKNDPTFPKPIRYSERGHLYFWKAELVEWIESHREAA